MLSSAAALFGNPISLTLTPPPPPPLTLSLHFKNRAFLTRFSISANHDSIKSQVHLDSLRVLEWDKLCDSVAGFARTPLGREATKAKLWCLSQTYEESLRLLDETNAAVEMLKHGACSLDFGGVKVVLVESAIQRARRSSAVEGIEAVAVMELLQYAEHLQSNLKGAIKEDAEWYRRFMPLSEVIMGFVVNRSLAKLIQQVIDEDGRVKDSASPNLKRLRNQVRTLEKKIYQLMNSLVRNDKSVTPLLEVSTVDGRWCIKSSANEMTSFKGLLLPSGSGKGSIVEPLSAVPLNDELQQTRALVSEAEAEVLSMLTEKMQMDLENIEQLLNSIIELDVVNARATYGLAYGGTCPNIYLPGGHSSSASDAYISGNKHPQASYSKKSGWVLYLPKAHHPLLLQQHRQNLKKARKDSKNVTLVHPVPVDFFITQKIRVLVITGPNTGGKTIGLKTVGLAAMMAKSGLHVLCSESVHIPWFDSVFADIGDEQSLSQSLSTFSGHLKHISDIQLQSTSCSLVLLDEVGAGTNPLEGAALGMSLLESFAETGALLTIATTHHGELKTLKYSNDAFENACMEFDEVNLKPTYRILWGVPGRSNAINIAERLGLPGRVVDNARELYGAASAGIDEVIVDMERLKQEYQELLYEAQNHLTISRELHEKLLVAKRKIMEHGNDQRFRQMREISEAAAMARSILHKKARKQRESAIQSLQPTLERKRQLALATNATDNGENSTTKRRVSSSEDVKKSPSDKFELPKVGNMVFVSSLGKKATVLRVEPSKEEILVQAGNIKMKLKLGDIKT
ncbi:putative endonuclease MutS2, P-loop containing nucleoside triphosphate hydrolase [Rosa chinensis]|uniref:Putative endonuclease MutS2, P-loop containing nucleoside triphosphate hydrolase n=1 Tax=Rosa chinensis TaxID=74649 RepID=A0A2P6SPK3_ROSCH|nr:endonuclease MutS2 isoform X2 [Rosa chinensis]PRQ60619.1 putative endonuclease MutS2, P-loop containing nucleoside triphosphate hydrolase [Rosa chinensis]